MPGRDARFWSRVRKRKSGCWEWIGAVNGRGYGALSLSGKWYSAHRYAYETEVGAIPSGLFVCHHCDNPPCVRPDHLFAGTAHDNARDMLAKGRHRALRGRSQPRALLTEEMVQVVRMYRKGRGRTPIKWLANLWGVSASAIRGAAYGRSWKHVGPATEDLSHVILVPLRRRLALFDEAAASELEPVRREEKAA